MLRGDGPRHALEEAGGIDAGYQLEEIIVGANEAAQAKDAARRLQSLIGNPEQTPTRAILTPQLVVRSTT
jgi:hypothetical protein